MENTQQPQSSSVSKFIMPAAVVAIIAIAVIATYTSKKDVATEKTTPNTPVAEVSAPAKKVNEAFAKAFKDGVYEAEGTYISPGGERVIEVSLTIKDNIVTDTTFKGNATDPASQRFQKEFGDNYTEMVVGQNINELQLTKVSGSSLTPKGFMDALEKIKTQAQS